MPRQAVQSVENSFRNGLVTEATGLNFPENACTETFDCIFNFDGSVQRRLGFDFEPGFSLKSINRTDSVVNSYLWRNVGGDGDVTVFVLQVGATLYFYRTNEDTMSGGAISSTVTLTPVSGAPTPATVEAQFADGNGLLFVTHRYCEPMRIEFNTTTDTASATNITIKIRDFEGADDGLGIEDRPTSTLAALDDDHEYNLRNQGWKTTELTSWDTAQTTMPSNADIMWRFVDSSGNFDAGTTSINRIVLGNTAAPKGHFILTLSDQNRDAAAGTSGVAATTTGHERPSTSAFFAGRLFYAGINRMGFNSKIYFTQIVERSEQYGFCYQANDPTGEATFDLLPTDGGVISINDAGTVYKLVTVPGGLAVFAANGVWFITGSQGIGFTANDYSVQKIAEYPTLTASSFVSVAGYPAWWNAEGIYIMIGEGNLPKIQSLTDQKIKSFFNNIPLDSKRHARGVFNNIEGTIEWLYRSEDTELITEKYEFDRVLNFNIQTGAFYPWRVSDSDVKINAVVLTDAIAGAISIDNVTANAGVDMVVDASSNQVVVFNVSGASEATAVKNKYAVSYVNGSTYSFTFAGTNNTEYLDWFLYDTTGVNFDSYFITGYKIRGQALRKFQSNWIRILSRINEPVQYRFQSIWDYAANATTGRWSSNQFVSHNDLNYYTKGRRLKVRGHGIALQFKVESVDGEPFDIIGWSNLDSINAVP